MAELQDPAYLDNGCITAQGDRQIHSSLVCSEGVAPGVGGELEVTERGAGANMSVDVASGNAFVAGTQASWQGMYHVSNDATKNIVVPAADPTDDRIDLVVARVRDSSYAGVIDDWSLDVVTGSPSPSPVAPSLPDNSLVLAEVAVAAGASSITNANITDMRSPYTLCSTAGTVNTIEYTANDTWTKPDGLLYVFAQVVGGGGAGGSTTSGETGAGAGGGGGGFAEGWINADDLTDTVAVTIGAAGAVAAGASGGAGGDSSFGAFLTGSGGGGGARSVAAGSGTGGAGGTGGGTAATKTVTGAAGGRSWFQTIGSDDIFRNGKGGDSGYPAMGGEGIGQAGNPGGGGGSGCYDANPVGAINGGAGGAGRVIVTEYF